MILKKAFQFAKAVRRLAPRYRQKIVLEFDVWNLGFQKLRERLQTKKLMDYWICFDLY